MEEVIHVMSFGLDSYYEAPRQGEKSPLIFYSKSVFLIDFFVYPYPLFNAGIVKTIQLVYWNNEVPAIEA